MNHIHRNRIRPGQTLKIPSSANLKNSRIYVKQTKPAKRKPSKLEPLIYVVRKGDTLSRIARTHDVSVNSLVKKNRLSNNGKVLYGQRLVID